MWLFRKLFFYFHYLRKPRWDTGLTPPEVVSFTGSHSPGRVLDLGCGTGTNSIYLAKHGWQVTGVDFVQTAVQGARRKAAHAGVSIDFICADVTRLLGVQGPFDLILDIGCLHSLPVEKRDGYYANLNALLGEDGFFLLYAFFNSEKQASIGLNKWDIENLSKRLKLVARQEGSDHGQRADWFTWCKKKGILTPDHG